MATEVKWIRIVVDVFDDEKIRIIEAMPEGDTLVCLWFKLLCLAGKSNHSGMLFIADRVPYTDEMLSVMFRKSAQIIRMAMQVFENFGMIELIEGTYSITNWEKHQSEDKLEAMREARRIRNRAYRERKQAALNAPAEGQEEDEKEASRETSPRRLGDGQETQQNKNKNKKKDLQNEDVKDGLNNCSSRARQDGLPSEFNELWGMYPAGRKQGKQKAWRAYQSARSQGSTFDEILKGLEGYKAYIQANNTPTQYIKLAQTWFSGKCWEDDYGGTEPPEASYGNSDEFMKAALERGRRETK